MILVNGDKGKTIDVTDRGFQYGDGLFETCEVRNGQPVLLDLHLQRLNAGCEKLLIPYPGFELLQLETQQICQHSELAVLKIIITRGTGGRGYKEPETIHATRVLSLHPFPDYPQCYKEHGITTRFCRTRLGLNPELAGIKHLNRLEQILARAEWKDIDIQEGIMLDINDNVIEGTMTNVFYVKNGILYTAILTHAGVLGIMRHVIMTIASEHNISVIQKSITKDNLLSADELFVCNSIIGIWPIKQLATSHFLPGKITGQLQNWLEQYKEKALSNDK